VADRALERWQAGAGQISGCADHQSPTEGQPQGQPLNLCNNQLAMV